MSECIDEATDAEKEQLRSIFETVLVASNASNAGMCMHLPTDDGPLCNHPNKNDNSEYHYAFSDYKSKPIGAYPPGWKPWCKRCIKEWRQGVTTREKQYLREEHSQIVVASGSSGNTRKLHIPENGEPACNAELTGKVANGSDKRDWRTKDVAVFPLGYNEWCENCVEDWRQTDDKREVEA